MPQENTAPSMANFKGHSRVKADMAELAKKLIGKKVVDVRWQTEEEMDALGWHSKSPMLVLEDGTLIVGQQDDEGNGAGPLCVIPEGDGDLADLFCVCS